MNALTISPFSSSITAIDTALAAVEGVALVLVSLFFAMQLCNEAVLLKIQSYEQVFKIFFKFIKRDSVCFLSHL
jgi:site-specific recombinase